MKNKKIILTLVACLATTFIAACSPKHRVSTSWKVDDTHHWHECADCEELFDKGEHDMKLDGEQAKTCTEDGYVRYKCSVCGFVDEQKATATGHTLESHDALAATCTADGNVAYYECTTCHKYFADELATQELTTVVTTKLGHDLEHIEAKQASYTQQGNPDCYYCKRCEKYFSDAAGTTEVTGGLVIPQLVCPVSVAKTLEPGSEIIVRGINVGTAYTGASLNINTEMLLKDENSNATIGITGATSTKLYEALGPSSAPKLAYPIGTIVEIPCTVTYSTTNYANGNAGITFLKYKDTDQELAEFAKGTASAAYDLTAEDIVNISTQEDFFRFLGLKNGSNVSTTEGFEYDYHIAGENAYKLIRMTNLQATYNNKNKVDDPELNWRPMFSDDVNTWAKSSISNSSNATNDIGAHQSFYPLFADRNTFTNTGKTFARLVYGDDAVNGMPEARDWATHLHTENTVYCMFIGGSDYYCQFVILSADWVVAPTPVE